MSACAELNRSLEVDCLQPTKKKYIQKVQLINRGDLRQYSYRSDFEFNRVTFNLNSGARAYAIATSDVANVIDANFSKGEENGIPIYTHRVSFPIVGAGEGIKVMLKQLDAADLFAVLQFTDLTAEVYGINYGLKTTGYRYSIQNPLGGAIITMESRVPEYEPPLIYYPSVFVDDLSSEEAEKIINEHFDNGFADIPDFVCGDFNADFNNDFNNDCDSGSTSDSI